MCHRPRQRPTIGLRRVRSASGMSIRGISDHRSARRALTIVAARIRSRSAPSYQKQCMTFAALKSRALGCGVCTRSRFAGGFYARIESRALSADSDTESCWMRLTSLRIATEVVIPLSQTACRSASETMPHSIMTSSAFRPDYVLEVREGVLHETDGQMLRHALQEVHGSRSQVPPSRQGQARHLTSRRAVRAISTSGLAPRCARGSNVAVLSRRPSCPTHVSARAATSYRTGSRPRRSRPRLLDRS
jgi:hypothetical protein